MKHKPAVHATRRFGEPAAQLNAAAWRERSRVNGPGDRFVLWLQGCQRACPGCFNPEMHPWVARHGLAVDQLAQKLLRQPGLEGVTYTGGEPLLQAIPLVALSERLRSGGLSIVCYTGYTLEELQRSSNPMVARLLAAVDILIDGPFEQASAGPLLWRGSDNQRVHFLTERYAAWAGRTTVRCAQMEVTVGPRQFTSAGIWPEGLVEEIQHALRGETAAAMAPGGHPSTG